MKALNKICWILAIVFGLGAIVLFFTDFASIVSGSSTVTPIGAQLAFGSKMDVAGTTYDLSISSKILFCFILTLISAVISAFSFKSKGLRYTAPVVGLIAAIFMLVIRLSSAAKFVDYRPLPGVTSVKYSGSVLFVVIALFAFVVVSTAYLFIDDYLEVKASDGEKMTIMKRLVRFFRDYKSEIKKIVWPGFKEVAKNTLIVLVMCLLVGILIWVVDFGLGQLLDVILG